MLRPILNISLPEDTTLLLLPPPQLLLQSLLPPTPLPTLPRPPSNTLAVRSPLSTVLTTQDQAGPSRGRALPHRHQGHLYPRRQRGPHHPVRARHHRASVTCRLCCSIRLRKVISPSTIISDNSLPKTCHHKIKVFPVFYSFSAN